MAIFQRTLRFLPIALGLSALLLAILSQASVFHVQDDSYMYARYAHNLNAGAGLAWDPAGEPTYGATSLLYVPWVATIARFLPDGPGRLVVIASLLSFLLAFSLMALLARQCLPPNTAGRGLIFCVCLTSLAFAHCGLAAHATNGMDTGLAMASLALLLFVWSRHASLVSRREPAPNRIWIVLASWIAFGVRPDLGLYSLGIPLVICVLAPASRRLGYALTALASAAAVALLLAWAWWYFGAPLTLSFYAKAMKAGYGPDFVRTHAPVAGQQLLLFAVFYAPLWIVALIDLPTRWRGARESENSLWLGVFAATLLHWIYYRFAVMQVVGAWQRFYYPTLPALMLLGATSAARMFASWQLRNSDAAAGKRLVYSGFALCSVVCALSLALPYSWMMRVLPSILAPYSRQFESATDMLRKEAGSGQLVNFSMEERYVSTKARSFWFALDGFSKLPDDLAIATTEVGLPAAMNPGKRIIDIAGLNENSFARHGFDARHLCEDLIPDVIYLPHPDYTTLIEALMKEPSFLREYELYPKQELHSFMDLALRRNSAYFESMRAIVAARRAENAPSGTRQAR